MKNGKSLVYIVDDDVSLCRAVALLLKSHGYNVETFNCSKDFLAYKHLKLPSCLLLDIQLPDIDGLALQKVMERKGISIPVVFITGHGDIPMSVKGMKAGAIDFLPKPFKDNDLLDAINRAFAKSRIQNKEHAEISIIIERIETLSPRELEVFKLVAKGMMSKNVAVQLGVSLQTIKVHRGRVMRKMHAETVTELIHFAEKAGIITTSVANNEYDFR